MKSLLTTHQNLTSSYSFLNLLIIGSVSVFLSACAAGPSTSTSQSAVGKKVCTDNEPVIGSNFSKHKTCRIISDEEQRQIDQQAQGMVDDQINRNVAARGSR